jgi:hypothetical protein
LRRIGLKGVYKKWWAILGLFQYLNYMAWNDRMIDELEKMWKEAVCPNRGTVPKLSWRDSGKSL